MGERLRAGAQIGISSSSPPLSQPEAAFESILGGATRNILFTGKGGVGKTTIACSTAVALADAGRRVLLVSTDPASNLGDVLGHPVAVTVSASPEVPGLSVLDIDPEAAARAYRERVVGPFRGMLPDSAVTAIEEQLSGGCTVEIAAFEQFAGLLADPGTPELFDHIVFDTAPTGHTLRLLSLPGAWTDYLDANTSGATCMGPLAGLERQREMYQDALSALADPLLTTIFLVTRPERTSIAECERTSRELSGIGLRSLKLIVNGVFETAGSDVTALALEARGAKALKAMPRSLAGLEKVIIPLRPLSLMGVEALRMMAAGRHGEEAEVPGAAAFDEPRVTLDGPAIGLDGIVDGVEAAGGGVVMAMGKGGVGKTTIASAVALELARRGHRVHLTTTDPAAHISDALRTDDASQGPFEAGSFGGNGLLTVGRIDPAAEVEAYSRSVIEECSASMDAEGIALLEEDLRSPCTEEIAVFRAFAKMVAKGYEDGFVILDTAPTGHTLMLLEASDAYSREVARVGAGREIPDEVAHILGSLRDPEHTKVVIVALPEPTPVYEAEHLQEDLLRAGITPFAWVVNQSLLRAGSSDPVLASRARSELPLVERVVSLAAMRSQHVAVVPWMPDEPRGVAGLLSFFSS